MMWGCMIYVVKKQKGRSHLTERITKNKEFLKLKMNVRSVIPIQDTTLGLRKALSLLEFKLETLRVKKLINIEEERIEGRKERT